MTLRAVIFDMDETLLDWSQHNADWTEIRQDHLRPIYRQLTEAGHSLPELVEVAEMYNAFNHDAWQSTEPPDWVPPRQLDVLRLTLRTLKVHVSEGELEEIQQLFAWGPVPGVRVYPDAVGVLRELRQAGVRTGLMTNAASPMWMRDRELEKLGLLAYLDVRMTAADVGHLKPHPRAFEAVLETLGIAPREAVFVGDRLYDDVSGAQGVGMRAVWVRRHDEEHEDGIHPDATIYELQDLPGVLDGWYRGWR